MCKWLWLVLAVLVAAAVVPMAAIGAETLTLAGNEFEVVWKHPRLKLEKQSSGELFSRVMSADDFVRQIKIDRREYTDRDGVSRPSLGASLPAGLIAQQVCDPATRYYRYGGNDVGIVLEISDFSPYNLELRDQDERIYALPRVQIYTDTVITSTTPEALALLIPVVEAVRTGDPDGGGCVWLLLLPVYAAPIPATPDLSQLSMLRILIRAVVKVPGRTFLPPSAPVPPPGPPGKG